MLIKFICCDVFTRIACDLVSKSPHCIDLEFVPMLMHEKPENLKHYIRDIIEKSTDESARKYDALILGFGLCGNAVIGLTCPIPMVIPRSHDCCTLHMGSKEGFIASFGDTLSSRWCSTGYFERSAMLRNDYFLTDQLENYKTSKEYMGYLEQYDEEMADYLWKTLHPQRESKEAVYIKIDGFEYSDSLERFRSSQEEAGISVREVAGDISMLKDLINGEWDEDRFLTIPPGKKIEGVYDMDVVMQAGD